MRRFISLLSVVSLFIASMVVSISAQDATPPAGEVGPPDSFEIAPGVVADNFLFAAGAEAPAVYRLTFAAGVEYEVVPSPNLELGYMESGSLVMTLDVSVTVKQVNDIEGQGETFSPGTEFTLEAGHYMVLQPGASGEIRNDSDEPAVLSVAGLTPAASGDHMGDPNATPDASPTG